MVSVNEVEDPVAVLAIPTEADLDTIEGIIQHSFDEIADDYAGLPPEESPEWLDRRGSLCQELLAQLHKEAE